MSGMHLQVERLTAAASSGGSAVTLIEDVSFDLEPGESLGLVGESGCGKSMTLHALAGLLPPGVALVSGSVRLNGRDLAAMPRRELDQVRGSKIGFVFQDPAKALNPLRTVGRQVAEGPRLHFDLDGKSARARAVEWLGRVGLPEPEKAFDAFPHQLSGGMRQRAMIAAALACAPGLLLADEPTTALDVTIQAQILALLHELRRELELSLIFVSHDLAVVSQMCDRVGVLYAGQLVEIGPTATVLRDPRHAYTQALLESMPEGQLRGTELPTVPGSPPDPQSPPAGCRFHPRCRHVLDECSSLETKLVQVDAGHASSCVHAEVGLPQVTTLHGSS